MTNKKGRKYDRKRWGWKDENDIKHPYYDSDRKKRTDEFSLRVSAFCIVGMVLILILAKIFQ